MSGDLWALKNAKRAFIEGSYVGMFWMHYFEINGLMFQVLANTTWSLSWIIYCSEWLNAWLRICFYIATGCSIDIWNFIIRSGLKKPFNHRSTWEQDNWFSLEIKVSALYSNNHQEYKFKAFCLLKGNVEVLTAPIIPITTKNTNWRPFVYSRVIHKYLMLPGHIFFFIKFFFQTNTTYKEVKMSICQSLPWLYTRRVSVLPSAHLNTPNEI